MTDAAVERSALYYPYIHIRNLDWLKGTLLCFQQIRRMVPHGFELNDPEEVRPLREIEGTLGPLLEVESLSAQNQAVVDCQKRLVERLEDTDSGFHEKHSRERAKAERPNGDLVFQIHRDKMLDDLFCYLDKHRLVWHARDKSLKGGWEWYGIHPRLGEAVMSVMAISLANDNGLDIVTSSGDLHFALAAQDEEAVFDKLLKRTAPPKTLIPSHETTDELVQLVMTTCFDVSRLSIEQVVELIQDGKALYDLKREVATIAGKIGPIGDPEVRRARLEKSAKEVVEHWQEYKLSLPKFAKDVLIGGADKHLPKALTSVAGAAMAGAVLTATLLGAATGFAIGLVTYAALAYAFTGTPHPALQGSSPDKRVWLGGPGRIRGSVDECRQHEQHAEGARSRLVA